MLKVGSSLKLAHNIYVRRTVVLQFSYPLYIYGCFSVISGILGCLNRTHFKP